MEKCTKNNVLKRLTTVMVFLRTCFYKVIKIYSFRMREETKINTDQFTWGSLKRRWQVSALLRMFANTNREKPKAVSLKMGGQGPCSSFLYSDPPSTPGSPQLPWPQPLPSHRVQICSPGPTPDIFLSSYLWGSLA